MSYFGLMWRQWLKEKKKMRLTEPIEPRGSLIYTVYKKGVPIEHVEEHNLVVAGGRTRLAELIGGQSSIPVTKIGFGVGTAQPSLADTTLEDLHVIDITSSTVSGTSVIFDWYLDEYHCNGMDIREFALFTTDDVMITHQQRGRVISKELDVTLKGQYILSF